jgi:hypothetical protein
MAARKSSSTAMVGVAGPLREEATAAAERDGMPVGEWIERAVRKALEEGLEPTQPAGVEIDELEAMVRRVVVEELAPLKEALAHPATTPSSPPAGGTQSNLMRMRMRRHRVR